MPSSTAPATPQGQKRPGAQTPHAGTDPKKVRGLLKMTFERGLTWSEVGKMCFFAFWHVAMYMLYGGHCIILVWLSFSLDAQQHLFSDAQRSQAIYCTLVNGSSHSHIVTGEGRSAGHAAHGSGGRPDHGDPAGVRARGEERGGRRAERCGAGTCGFPLTSEMAERTCERL